MPDEMNPEMNPEMSAPAPEMGAEPNSQPLGSSNGEVDREGAIAKADLYKLANYSHKLFKQIHDDDQMEAWVQAKITKAADYIASVYHYLEYEMKFSEYGHHLDNSDTLSEGQKMRIKEMLAEAKDKMKDLKKSQAEKVKEKKMDEGILSGGDRPCTECGGTGMVYEEPKPIPAHVKGKVAKYNTMVKATKAAHKRMDANGDGVPDEEVVDEEFTDKSKVGDTFKTRTGVATKTDTGMKHNNTSYHDDGEAEEKSGKGVKSHAKAQSAAEKKDRAPAQKQSPKSAKTWGMKDGSKFDNRDKPKDESVAEGKKAKKDYDGDGKIETEKDEVIGSRRKAAGLDEASPSASIVKEDARRVAMLTNLVAAYEAEYKTATGSNKTNLARTIMIFRQQLEAETEAERRAQDAQQRQVQEGKPSAGLSKAKKSATVKDAKAGKDIGKPGKGFDKLAKKAGGGEKGEKIAAAAMWKNIKETTAYIAEKAKATKPDFLDMDKDGDKKEPMKKAVADKKKETVKESTDFSRMQEQLARLNRSEKPTLVENREVDQIRALTQRLLG